MSKEIFTIKSILLGVGFIILDIFIYILLGIFLMGYDDSYDESKGPYFSLESMTNSEKALYIGINIWNILNLLLLAYLIYRIIKLIFNNKAKSSRKQ